MKSYKILSVLIALLTFITSLSAQNLNCYLRQAFTVRKGSALEITNKYGDVNVITTKDDSITVCATITINQDKQELVQKNMKLIKISINKINDTIYVSTLYDKKFFSEEFRKGRTSFSTDYLIKLPEYLTVKIRNEFGNISIDDLSGLVDIRLTQGNLKAKKLTRGNLKPLNTLNADHASVLIGQSNWLTMNLVNCTSIEVGKAQALNINSSVSKMYFGELSSLISISKSDHIKIRKVNNIISEGTYSTYDIGNVNGQLKSVIRYGTLKISGLTKNFKGLYISSDHSNVSLKPAPDASFRADISSTDKTVVLISGMYPNIIKANDSSSENYNGFAGQEKEAKSFIRISATSGKVVLD